MDQRDTIKRKQVIVFEVLKINTVLDEKQFLMETTDMNMMTATLDRPLKRRHPQSHWNVPWCNTVMINHRQIKSKDGIDGGTFNLGNGKHRDTC